MSGTSADYEAFLARKAALVPPTGIAHAAELPAGLFPFQADLVRWALRRGRAAIFAATGLGKSRMAAAWADEVRRETGKPILVLAPLAVATPWTDEAWKIGVAAVVCREPADLCDGINVTNYDRLDKFATSEFGGVVWDESSVAKHFTTATFKDLRDRFAEMPFRLACTATPAPNDWTELGTHAELLGVCTRTEMLAEFFCHDGGETQVWRLKGHARDAFWRWVASWAALVSHPRDLGYEDQKGYDLPPLVVEEHLLPEPEAAKALGVLFAEEARTLSDQRAARRASLDRRVESAARAIAAEPRESWLVWCDLNAESKALAQAIPGAVEATGAMDIDEKEARIGRFLVGETRVLVTKPSIASFGINAQVCARQAFVGVTHSFEAYFQAIRRSWRFGQTREVRVHVFASELEGAVVANLKRKERDAEAMALALVAETAAVVREEVRGTERTVNAYDPREPMRVPAWLTTEVES